MSHKEHAWIRLSGITGIIAPIIAFTCILFSIASYPPFSWTNNALSDLGVQEGITASLFNGGLMISGILGLFFAVGLFKLLDKNISGKIGVLVFALAALALITIAVFPENMKPMHYHASVAFFVFFPIAMLVIASSSLYARNVRTGLFTLTVAIIAAVPWAIEFSAQLVPGIAIPEAISAVAASVWCVALGITMLSKTSQSHS
jgi:hypothetical membrane protein